MKPVFHLEMLDPVDQLLVRSIRVDLDDGRNLKAVEEACSALDGDGREVWRTVADRASYQGVIGWTHEALSLMKKDSVPAGCLEKLREARLQQTARIATVAADMAEVLGSLTAAGIRHIVLKGPFLCEHVYPRPDLRYFTDIDLLIPRSDVENANRVLQDTGYQLVEDSAGFFDQSKTQAHYYRDRSLPIDLHWELVNYLPSHLSAVKPDMDEIWSAAVPVRVAGVETMAMSPEDVLLFQCIHLTVHHDFNRILWFKDVEQVIRHFHDEIDWPRFVQKCSRYGLKSFIYYSILMTADVCGELDVPGWVMDSLRPKYLGARLFEHLARKSNILEMQENRRRPALEVWKLMRDRRLRRWLAIADRIFPRVGWYLECYPFLPKIRHRNAYYAIYPALMALRLFKRPIRLNLSDSQKSR